MNNPLRSSVGARWNTVVVLPALLALAGCQGISSGNAITPQATSGQITVKPASVSFSKVQVGYNQSQPMTMTNSGGASVSVAQATVTGTGFSVSGLSLPLNLAAGQSQPFTITFTPKSNTASNGNLAIVNNGVTPTVNVPLSGNAETEGALTVNPASLDFGSVRVGSNQPLAETLINAEGSSITVTQATVTGTGFSTSGLSLPLTLPAGQNQPFTVTFAPQSAGSSQGNLALTSSGSNSVVNVPLGGNGLTAGALTASPSSIGFGNVQVGNEQTLYETLTNSSGSSNVTISEAAITGASFGMSGLVPPVVLTPGQHYTFSVTFTPLSAEQYSGSISVTSNASNTDLEIPLTGTGTSAPAGQLSISPSPIAFGNVADGSYASLPVTLSASGASVTVTSNAVTNSAFTVSGLALPVTIPSGQKVQFTMTFTPQGSGQASGNLSFTSNAGNSPTAAPLTGTGVQSTHTVSLSWTASSSQNVTGYYIYRATTSGGPYSELNSGAPDLNTNYTDSTVLNGQTYYYVTTAVDTENEQSSYSNQATAVIPAN
jgi:hypothetical protein